MSKIGTFIEKPFPKSREIIIESVEAGKRMNHVIGMFELDVTKGREIIRKHKEKTGEQLSFTAWMIKCIGQAVGEQKQLHALRKGRRKIIIFDDVHIRLNIEKTIDGVRTISIHIVRKANEKSFREIHDEIRRAQGQENGTGKAQSEKRKKSLKGPNLLISLPKFIRRIIWWKLRKDPFYIQKNLGTVGVTSLGSMFKNRPGWGITKSPHTLSIALGSIAEKPGVVNKKILIREYLSITVMFNHDVVDGAPAARFLTLLADLVEDGFGLTDL